MRFLVICAACALLSGCATPKLKTVSASSVPRDEMVHFGVPVMKQDGPRSCGAAALSMVLAYYERPIPQEEIMRRLDDGARGGLRADRMKQLLEERGLRAFVIAGKPEDLPRYADRRIPLILARQTGFSDGVGYHYMVLAGHSRDHQHLVLNDPDLGQVLAPTRDFLPAWADAKNFVLIAAPAGPSRPAAATANAALPESKPQPATLAQAIRADTGP